MNIKKIQFKNFRSYSNQITTIDFDDKNSLNLIIGKNGSGKSSIAHLIQYLLYGKIDDVNNKDLANRINKNFWGKIDVECSGHLLEIERGLYPNLFTIKIDGEDYDVAGKLDVQKTLEEKYFKINYSLFKTLIILNINEFKSLVELSPSDKKKIIDKIFGFGILNQIFDKVKSEFNGLNNALSNIDSEISLLENNIESTRNKINDNNGVSEVETIDKYNQKLIELKDEFVKISDTKQKLDKINNQLKDNISSNRLEIQIIDKDILQLKDKIKLFNSGKCPLCGSDLSSDHYKDEIDKLSNEIVVLENNKGVLVQAQTDIIEKLNVVTEKFEIINKKNDIINNNIISVKANIGALNKIKDSNNTIDELLNEFCLKLDKLKSDRVEIDKKIEFIKIVMSIFSQNGVKKYVNQIYTPMINDIILEISEKLQLFYKVEFNDDFDCKIYSNGIEVNYSTLSSGEKRRLDFAIIISFIKLLKLQSASSNVMFLDEIFATLDINAIDSMIDILKKLSSELNCNIFLIHHSELEQTRFDNVYEITKHSMFSELSKINA